MEISDLTGTIKHIVYQSADESFTVARFKTGDENITIVGPLYGVKREQEIRIWGVEKKHPKYGKQIQVERFEVALPSGREQIVDYLTSTVRNVGPKRARAIVDKLGEECLKIIVEQGPEVLADIKGINSRKAEEIYQSLAENLELQYVLSALLPFGLSANMAVKAYQAWGFNAISAVKENPYLLAEITVIGFFRADLIAKNMGIPDNAPYRLQAALKHLLLEAEGQGHCFLPEEELLRKIQDLLNQWDEEDQARHREALEVLLANQVLVREGERVYLCRLYEAEEKTVEQIGKLCYPKPTASPARIEECLDLFEAETGLQLAEEQKLAVRTVMETGLCILTGGPGTGKTLTVNAVIAVLRKLREEAKVSLASPTGRAGQNLAEVTGEEAGTIHRLLGFRPGEGPEHDAKNPLDCDLLVIDEVSMLDISLAAMLFKAVDPVQTRVLLVGDADQLPSVGPGNVLQDLIEAGVPSVKLTHIFRQAATSQIVTNAHRINKGEMLTVDHTKGDFFFLEHDDPEAVAFIIKKAALRFLELGYSVKDIQVLSPMHKGPIGTMALNGILQEALNPPHPETRQVQVGQTVYREGDRVMQLKNNYNKQVFNGDVGFITQIIPADARTGQELEVLVEVRGEIVEYSRDEVLEELSLAYCMTVHKAQGGEVPIVIMPVSTQHYYMLARNLLYTGITRAKEKVVLVGTRKALARAINNNKTTMRYTALADKIRQTIFSNVDAGATE
ncbi:MAG: ATP-dependent RecD-like DNA helicase [Clostridia bacterium]|jgi:exodeoxyribonuclease V alpha subunit|nr:ATP-dependent RecD-like DNA helicase [Clostridia bacterium]